MRLLCMAALASATLLGQWRAATVLEVEGDRVTAGDLGRLIPAWRQLPAASEILPAPMPGLTRELWGVELERLALRHGIGDVQSADWPERVQLRRRMRRLALPEVEAAVAASLARRYRISPEDVGLDLIGFVPPQVPSGELEFRTYGAFPRPGEVTTIPLTWVTRERRSGTLWLRGRVSLLGRRAVAARALGPRTPIEPGDVRFEDKALEAGADRWVVSPAELEGKVLTRALRAGEPIVRGWLLAARTVERGASVELTLRSGAVELRAPGRAEQAGSIGDRIPFRNLASGRRLTARVLDRRRAEVVAP